MVPKHRFSGVSLYPQGQAVTMAPLSERREYVGRRDQGPRCPYCAPTVITFVLPDSEGCLGGDEGFGEGATEKKVKGRSVLIILQLLRAVFNNCLNNFV